MDTSIPALFSSRFNALKTICSRIERESTSDTDLLQISRWQDELGRLRLWAANIGAHRTGQSSLEFRLKDSSHIGQQVTNLLLDLGQIFQEVEDILDSLANGHASQMEEDNASDDDYDTGEELTQLHSNIVTVINCLFQMSMLVRRPARHDFYMLPQSQEVLAFRPYDQAYVREKYPKADQGLIERLGLAITLRRQYLRYRERHHAKLNQGLDVGTEDSAAPTVVLSDTVVPGVEPWHIDSQDQDKAPASEKSQTSYAPSMLAGGALIIPSPPKKSSGGAPFECPYCFVMISVDGVLAWHKHVFQDLQPYTCTVVACSTPHTLFSTRHEWVHHLKGAHPREWTGNKNRAAAAISESNESYFCAICPLCKSNSKLEKHFVRHLARHLQELALFVLRQDEADSDIDDGPDPELLGKSNSESSVSSTISTNPEHEKSHDEQQVHDRQSDRDLKEAFALSAAERLELERPLGQLERLEDERPGREKSDHALRLERLEQMERRARERARLMEPMELQQREYVRFISPDPPDDRRRAPSSEPSGASRQPGPTLNDYFVDGTGIHRGVMQSKICKYLGPEAYSKPHISNV